MTQALKRGLFGYRTRTVKQVLADREQMFERATRDVRDAETRYEVLSLELDGARSDLETARAEMDTARTELETARTELETARTEVDSLEADLQTVRSERDAANAERDTLLAELVTARTERDSLRTEVSEHGGHLEEANARAARLEAELDVARTRARTEGDRARTMAAELAAARRDLAESGSRIQALEESLRHLEQAPMAQVAETEPPASAVASSGDLDQVLQQTESTIHRIVEEARRGAERELADVERRRDAVRAEVEALIARRDRLAPLARSLGDLLGEAQARTEEAETRLQTALEPLTRTVGVVRDRLIELIDEAEREDEATVEVSEEDEGSEGSSSAVIHLAGDPRTARSPW